MCIRDRYYDAKEDTVKKVSLIDDLSANMSYNMAAKDRPWSDLNINLRLKLTKSYTFNMNASFATYAYTFDKSGNVAVSYTHLCTAHVCGLKSYCLQRYIILPLFANLVSIISIK